MAGPSVQNGANGAKAIGNQETNHLMQDIQFPMHSNSHGVYIGNSFNIGNSSTGGHQGINSECSYDRNPNVHQTNGWSVSCWRKALPGIFVL